jgi:hypothetical protein
LTLASAPTPVLTPTWQYKVIRQPRVLQGEEALQLPQNVAIDLVNTNNYQPQWASGVQSIDILFSPSGTVIDKQGAFETLVLRVRDTTQDITTDGDQTLLAIYTRTGLTATYPVDVSSGDPYSFLKAARPAGP